MFSHFHTGLIHHCQGINLIQKHVAWNNNKIWRQVTNISMPTKQNCMYLYILHENLQSGNESNGNVWKNLKSRKEKHESHSIYLWNGISKLIGIAQSVQRRAKGWTTWVRFLAGARFFSSPQRPDRLWGPPSLLFNGYRGLFPQW
jgi:hypothetical protein